MPSCASLFIKDMSISNGMHYFIYSNFLGNTFPTKAFENTTKPYWYGFERNDIFLLISYYLSNINSLKLYFLAIFR